jgi:hypothetical protein
MAIYFQTKSGIMIKEYETPAGLVYVKKNGNSIEKEFNEQGELVGFRGGEILEKVFNEKKELIGFKDSNGTFIDDFVKDGKAESLALYKLSFDVYPDPNKNRKGRAVKVDASINTGAITKLLEKTKKTKKDYVSMFNSEKNNGGNNEKESK